MASSAQLAARDPIYGRIGRAVPRRIDQCLRDDIMGDVYLAIREGHLHPRNIEVAARRFAKAVERSFAPRWGGAVSLERLAKAGGDGTMLMKDMIEDPSALASFDEVRFTSEISDE